MQLILLLLASSVFVPRKSEYPRNMFVFGKPLVRTQASEENRILAAPAAPERAKEEKKLKPLAIPPSVAEIPPNHPVAHATLNQFPVNSNMQTFQPVTNSIQPLDNAHIGLSSGLTLTGQSNAQYTPEDLKNIKVEKSMKGDGTATIIIRVPPPTACSEMAKANGAAVGASIVGPTAQSDGISTPMAFKKALNFPTKAVFVEPSVPKLTAETLRRSVSQEDDEGSSSPPPAAPPLVPDPPKMPKPDPATPTPTQSPAPAPTVPENVPIPKEVPKVPASPTPPPGTPDADAAKNATDTNAQRAQVIANTTADQAAKVANAAGVKRNDEPQPVEEKKEPSEEDSAKQLPTMEEMSKPTTPEEKAQLGRRADEQVVTTVAKSEDAIRKYIDVVKTKPRKENVWTDEDNPTRLTHRQDDDDM